MKIKLLSTVLALMLSQNILNADVLAVVNGENLTEEDIKPMLSMFHDAKSIKDLNENEKKMIIDQTLEKKLILQQAIKDKVEENPRFVKIMKNFKDRLIVEFWMKEYLKEIKVSEQEIKDYMAKNKEHHPKKEEIKNKVKMQKFQVQMDEKLSNMKKAAKIEYK
ncbi:MAG TPA: hypothetical protein EYH01_02110 [Campylobacterales bacterium]|nr:hypothetical protein [Campylobacterales bacterium]